MKPRRFIHLAVLAAVIAIFLVALNSTLQRHEYRLDRDTTMIGAANFISSLGSSGDSTLAQRLAILAHHHPEFCAWSGSRIYFNSSADEWRHVHAAPSGDRSHGPMCFILSDSSAEAVRSLWYVNEKWVFYDHDNVDSLPIAYVSLVGGRVESSVLLAKQTLIPGEARSSSSMAAPDGQGSKANVKN